MRHLDEDTYPIVWIGSEVPDYLSLIVKDGFGLNFEATHDRQVFPLWRVSCEVGTAQTSSTVLIRLAKDGKIAFCMMSIASLEEAYV